MENWFIPSIKNQTLVLDRLAEFYFSWINTDIELMSEMTWEISFVDLRSTILYLVEFWYIQRFYSWKTNEFHVRITKKWILHYEKIFQPEKKIHIKNSFLQKIKNFWEWIDAIKWIATWAVAIFTIFWISFYEQIWNNFSANISQEQLWNNWININFTEVEAIQFLKNKMWQEFNFSCEIKESEAICKIVKDGKNNLNTQSVKLYKEEEKTILDKKMVLKKIWDEEIIFMK